MFRDELVPEHAHELRNDQVRYEVFWKAKHEVEILWKPADDYDAPAITRAIGLADEDVHEFDPMQLKPFDSEYAK